MSVLNTPAWNKVNQKKMTSAPNQYNFSEHKKALRIRYQRTQQREWIINQMRQSYSTNLKPNQSSHQSSRSEFKLGQISSMRKEAPLSNQLEDIPKLVNGLDFEWNSFQTVYDTACRFRKFLSQEHNPPISQVIDSGAVPYFVQLLAPAQIEQYCQIKQKSNEPTDPSKMNVISKRQLYELQLEVTWCITNIVSGTSEHTKYIVQTGCVPYLINLIESEDCEVRRQCAWAIGNIAGDSSVMRDYVIAMGAMKYLVNLVERDHTVSTRRNSKCEIIHSI